MTQKEKTNLTWIVGIIVVLFLAMMVFTHFTCWDWWPFSRGCAVTLTH